MPAPKAILRDIHDLKLDPTQHHSVFRSSGRLVKHYVVECEVSSPVVKCALVMLEQKETLQEPDVFDQEVPLDDFDAAISVLLNEEQEVQTAPELLSQEQEDVVEQTVPVEQAVPDEKPMVVVHDVSPKDVVKKADKFEKKDKTKKADKK